MVKRETLKLGKLFQVRKENFYINSSLNAFQFVGVLLRNCLTHWDFLLDLNVFIILNFSAVKSTLFFSLLFFVLYQNEMTLVYKIYIAFWVEMVSLFFPFKIFLIKEKPTYSFAYTFNASDISIQSFFVMTSFSVVCD
jgi:hypothetical protein